MKIYEVINGWTGISYVRCYVKANNEKEAIEKALYEYKKKAKEENKSETYYNELRAELLMNEDQEITKISDE